MQFKVFKNRFKVLLHNFVYILHCYSEENLGELSRCDHFVSFDTCTRQNRGLLLLKNPGRDRGTISICPSMNNYVWVSMNPDIDVEGDGGLTCVHMLTRR